MLVNRTLAQAVSPVNYYSPYQFALFRIIFGVYIISNFIMLIFFDSPFFGSRAIFAVLLVIPSIFFTLGRWRRVSALLICIGWAYLIDRNSLVSNLITVIALFFAFVPRGEPLVLGKKHKALQAWHMPWPIFFAAWLLLAAYYGLSGLYQMQKVSFIDGTAFWHLLNSPMARENWLVHALLALPPIVLNIGTWGFLLLELVFLPLCLFSLSRKWVWLSMLLIQIAALMVLKDQTLGLIMLHLFVFDARFLRPPAFKERPIVFFDGYCGLCNWFVDFALSEDQMHSLLFSPLQGEAAKSRVGQLELQKLESFILYDNNKIYRQSDAILRVLAYLGGLWPLFKLAKILPRKFRDYIYHVIATHRYQWFGKHEACRLPSLEQRKFFVP